jgi:hypothetical protein
MMTATITVVAAVTIKFHRWYVSGWDVVGCDGYNAVSSLLACLLYCLLLACLPCLLLLACFFAMIYNALLCSTFVGCRTFENASSHSDELGTCTNVWADRT